MPDPEAMLESLGQPRLNRVEPAERPLAGPASSAAGSSRSPVPPPHIPDASAGMKSESSVRRLGPSEEATDGMIEADAERAGAEVALPSPVLQEPGSAVGSGNAYATTAPAGEACRCRSGQREHAHVPSRCAARPGHQLVPNRPAPAPYVYSGPGLPPPASFESFRRTPECYRGVWDGYATEKARRCRFCHDHLHDRCSCHQEACSTADPWVGQPAGHCARAASASPRGY